MMKSNASKIYFLVSLVLIFFITLAIKTPLKINTSLDEILPINEKFDIPSTVLNKFSSNLNVIVENKDFKTAKKDADLFYQNLIKNNFSNITYSISDDLLEKIKVYGKKYQFSFLTDDDREDLKQGDTKIIIKKSIDFITTSLFVVGLSESLDPFSIFNRYIKNLLINSLNNVSNWKEKDSVLWQNKNGMNYILINIPLTTSNMDILQKEVKKIDAIYKNQNLNSNFYFSSSALHTVKMFNKSKIEIAVISISAILWLLFLSWFLLKDKLEILKVFINLFVGFLCAILGLILFSDSIHILSFVFGSSLIGICIDYTFHTLYLKNEYELQSIKKSLFCSFITTIFCFVPLLFLSIPLLREVGIFTICGLIGTYLYVVLFFKWDSGKNTNVYTNDKPLRVFTLSKKLRVIICLIILAIVAFQVKHLNINNSLSSLYNHNDNELLKADKLFYELNNVNNSNFLIVKGKNLEELLETSEWILENNKDIKDKIFLFSKLLPSKKRQLENQDLVKKLYDSEGEYIKNEFGIENFKYFKKLEFIGEKEFKRIFGKNIFNKFIVKDNGYWSVIPLAYNIENLPKNAKIVSIKGSLLNILNTLSDETRKALLGSFLFLTLLIVLIYKKKVFIYLLPSFFSIMVTLVLINSVVGYLTFFHLISLFIVLGLSIDYTIFHLNSSNLKNLKPILFSFLSSFIGFGLLSFASFSIISIMGLTISVGLLFSYLFSLFIIRS